MPMVHAARLRILEPKAAVAMSAEWEEKLKILVKALAGLAMASMLAIGAAEAQDKGSIGIAMPTRSSARSPDSASG